MNLKNISVLRCMVCDEHLVCFFPLGLLVLWQLAQTLRAIPPPNNLRFPARRRGIATSIHGFEKVVPGLSRGWRCEFDWPKQLFPIQALLKSFQVRRLKFASGIMESKDLQGSAKV